MKRQQMTKYILGGVIAVGLTFFCASSAVSVENSKYKLTLDRLPDFLRQKKYPVHPRDQARAPGWMARQRHCHYGSSRRAWRATASSLTRWSAILTSCYSDTKIESTRRFPSLSEKLSRERWQLCVQRGCSLWLWRPPRSRPGGPVPPSFVPPSFRFQRAQDEHRVQFPDNPALATSR